MRSVWMRYSAPAHVLEVSLSRGSSAFLLKHLFSELQMAAYIDTTVAFPDRDI